MRSRISCRVCAATAFRRRLPRGVGESSAVVNVLWGFLNLAIGIALLYIFLPQLPPPWPLCAVALIGGLILALYLAWRFGRVRNEAPHP